MDGTAGSVEERLARVEARVELLDLVARYCVAIDDADFDMLRELFTSDMRWEASRVVEGREAVLANVRHSLRSIKASAHTPDFQTVRFEGADEATGLVGSHVELARRGEAVFGVLRYHDRYRREAGQWRFSARRQRVVYLAPWHEVPTALLRAAP